MIVCLSLWGKLLIRHAFLPGTNLIKRLKHSRQLPSPSSLQPHKVFTLHWSNTTLIWFKASSPPKKSSLFPKDVLARRSAPTFFLYFCLFEYRSCGHNRCGSPAFRRRLIFKEMPFRIVCLQWYTTPRDKSEKNWVKEMPAGSHTSRISAEPSIKVRPSQNTDNPVFQKHFLSNP